MYRETCTRTCSKFRLTSKHSPTFNTLSKSHHMSACNVRFSGALMPVLTTASPNCPRQTRTPFTSLWLGLSPSCGTYLRLATLRRPPLPHQLPLRLPTRLGSHRE